MNVQMKLNNPTKHQFVTVRELINWVQAEYIDADWEAQRNIGSWPTVKQNRLIADIIAGHCMPVIYTATVAGRLVLFDGKQRVMTCLEKFNSLKLADMDKVLNYKFDVIHLGHMTLGYATERFFAFNQQFKWIEKARARRAESASARLFFSHFDDGTVAEQEVALQMFCYWLRPKIYYPNQVGQDLFSKKLDPSLDDTMAFLRGYKRVRDFLNANPACAGVKKGRPIYTTKSGKHKVAQTLKMPTFQRVLVWAMNNPTDKWKDVARFTSVLPPFIKEVKALGRTKNPSEMERVYCKYFSWIKEIR